MDLITSVTLVATVAGTLTYISQRPRSVDPAKVLKTLGQVSAAPNENAAGSRSAAGGRANRPPGEPSRPPAASASLTANQRRSLYARVLHLARRKRPRT